MESSEEYKVYGLCDPREPQLIRYVGVTRLPLKQRLYIHCRKDWPNQKRGKWVSELRAAGLTPLIIELEKCSSEDFSRKEKQWIAKLAASGNLTNTNGTKVPSESDNSLASRLQRWRKAKGYRIKEAADKLDISYGAFRKYEEGSRAPSPLGLIELERRLASNGG